MTLSIFWPFKRSTVAQITATILLGTEADILSSTYTWMLEQVLAISPFNSTKLVGRLLLMRLFTMFHTSSIMFRLRLLAGQLSNTWILCSCSHVSIYFVCRSVRSIQKPDLAEKSCLHRHTDAIQMSYRCHTDAIQMPYRSSMDETRWLSNTFIYTVWCICSCWFEENNIAHTSCSYTTLHYYGSWEPHKSLQISRILTLIFSSPNQSSSITKFAQFDFWSIR